jgi:hypothetical protein
MSPHKKLHPMSDASTPMTQLERSPVCKPNIPKPWTTMNKTESKYSETSIYRSWIHRSISMVPERILFQLWLLHLLFSRIQCFFFRPPTKKMNRGFTV